jgi:mannose-1-phosphate guanylyltransferase
MYVVIMAGGSGTRFWPASRKDNPKQFLNISGKDPMVVETCNRLKPLASENEMILVLGREHLRKANELFENQDVHLVAEPVGRNTAPCIGLGAIYAQYMGCSGAVAFLPADHFIGDPSAFVQDLGYAGEIAESGGIVTLGIIPTRPETGYGYIRRSKDHPDFSQPAAYKVSAFVEKPDLEQAQVYLASGEYFWNAGIFVATPDTIMKEIQNCLPDLYQALKRLEQVLGTDAFEAEIEDIYPALESVSFDYGIMEKATSPLFVLPCNCGWSDVGSWASLYELRGQGRDPDQNLIEGEPLLIDCEKSFISSRSGRVVACLGLENCLVVDTPDALLIADLKKSEEIRKIVEQLENDQRERYL